jgi:serine phosphatase RsbU (regulator of sigma subunit)
MAGHGMASLLHAPLVARGEVVGGLLFLERRRRRRYTAWEREFASRLGLAVSLALETARLFQTQKDIADVLQEALLAVPQSIPGLEVQHLYRSATQAARVGGDFYDLFLLEEGKVAALIGDVSGHGVAASSQAAYVRDTVKAYLYQGLPLDRVLDLANQAVVRRDGAGFVTLFAAVLDIASGEISYSSAGHPPPVLRRRGGEALQLELASPPLGTFADAAYPVGRQRMEEGDLLVLFTDGLIEARQGGALFGEAGLLRVLREGSDDLSALGRRLMKEVLAYGGGRLTDDVALVLLAFRPSRGVDQSAARRMG